MHICKTTHLSMLKQSKTTSVFGYARGLSRSYASCPAVSHNDNSISSPFRFIDFTVVSKTVGVWSSGICPFYKWKIAFVITFRVEGKFKHYQTYDYVPCLTSPIQILYSKVSKDCTGDVRCGTRVHHALILDISQD